MKQNQLQKAINLIKKTGDKIMVIDPNDSNSSYILMSIDDYDALVTSKSDVKDLTEDELLDKINRDIAIWKSEQIEDNSCNFVEQKCFAQDMQKKRELKEEENEGLSYIEEKVRNTWNIPKKRKVAAEEIIDEDRQYLEEVDF